VAASVGAAEAQNVVPLFSSVDVRKSTTGTTVAEPNVFATAPLNLSCPASGITGVLSGPLPTANSTPTDFLVDNYIAITVEGETTNLCGPPGAGADGNPASCFRSAYAAIAKPGLDPDYPDGPNGPLGVVGGVAPLDVASYLTPGANQVTFDVVDFGGLLASSTINLVTNCAPTGVSGNGKVSGNPISSTNPTPAQLTQPFTFSAVPNLGVQLLLDLSTAYNQGTLSITNQATPTATDSAIDPAAFPAYVAGTSFATSQCLIHSGELFNGAPACKLYTLTCQIAQGAQSTGVQCPTSTARNIVLQDVFDFPALSLPDILYTDGNFSETFHQGFGFLEASEGWTGGPCTFDPGAGQTFSCPENLLTQFTGPGSGKSTGTPSPRLNSTFISVGPVPEYRTHVDLNPWQNHMWVNSHNVTATFNTRSPILPPGYNDGDTNSFKAAPLYSITYGVSTVADQPSTEFPLPTDTTLLYPNGCNLPAPVIYEPAPVQLQVSQDGEYLVHFFATDCAGTEELFFYQDKAGSWNTTFYTAQMFVDTVAPQFVAEPQLSPEGNAGTIQGYPAYHRNTPLSASYQCSDDFSGVAVCGAQTYATPVKTPAQVVSPLSTSQLGGFGYGIYVKDAAGNITYSDPVFYWVVP
jgi:hypothetical protein